MSKLPACAAFAAMLVAASTTVSAQDIVFSVNNLNTSAKIIEQTAPSYPRDRVRRGQEGWVLLNYVVTPEGRAVDPVILDSTGGVAFEEAVREVLPEWRFNPPGSTLSNNMASVRFELKRGRDMATSNFLRRYRRIVTHLHHEETPEARAAVDQAQELGGWNLYETTMLCLMLGRVNGAEGNMPGKLEYYRRALRVSNRNSLDGEDRRDLLMRIFGMEMDASQFAAARLTLALLRKEPDSDVELAKIKEPIAELERRLGSEDSLHARATISNPCDCDAGEPLWTYWPLRRKFSFTNLDGDVDRFEMRCENERLQNEIEAGRQWSVPESARNCRIFVFGEDGATFDFVEHGPADPDIVFSSAALAKNDVLDRRNRN